MESIEPFCFGKAFAVWGLYSVAVVVITRFMAEGGWPEISSWIVAGIAGVALLLWTREI